MNLRMTAQALFPILVALGIVLPGTAGAQSASERLTYYDKTSTSGALDVVVDLYAAPDKTGKYGTPTRYPAQVLFQRPNRFRLALRPGQNNEYRAVADAGIVRWLDLATGVQGKATMAEVVDPMAIALLAVGGELSRHNTSKDLPLTKASKVAGARLQPRTWGTPIVRGEAWFSTADGRPTGFEFIFADGRKVFIAVSTYQLNPQIPTSAWQL